MSEPNYYAIRDARRCDDCEHLSRCRSTGEVCQSFTAFSRLQAFKHLSRIPTAETRYMKIRRKRAAA